MPVLYFNPASGQTFICTLDTEDQFQRQMGDRWDLTKFRRIVARDFVNIEPTTSEGCNKLSMIEDHSRMTVPVAGAMFMAMIRSAARRFFY